MSMVDTLDATVALEALAPDADARTQSLAVRIPTRAYEHLQRIADREAGGNLSDLVRGALHNWLELYHRRRQADLKRLEGLTPELAEQARALFRAIPAHELGDDEALEMTANGAGELIVRLPDDRHYFLFQEHAVRLRTTGPETGEMTLWREGAEVERRTFSLAEMAAWSDSLKRGDAPLSGKLAPAEEPLSREDPRTAESDGEAEEPPDTG